MRFLFVFFLFFASELFAQGSENGNYEDFPAKKVERNPSIAVSINPIYQILVAITQDEFNGTLIINPKLSEHRYQLRANDLEKISHADLVFYISDESEPGFAKLARKSESPSKFYPLSDIENLKIFTMREDSHKMDSHFWLDPQNAIKIARFMARKLGEISPQNYKKYQKNLARFKKEVSKVESIIREDFLSLANRDNRGGYVIFHDGYQYFEEYFDLRPREIIIQSLEQGLSIKDFKELDHLVKKGKVSCIFGNSHEEKNSAMQMAKNFRIKFVALNLMETKEEMTNKKWIEDFSGYPYLLLSIANDVKGCLEKSDIKE